MFNWAFYHGTSKKRYDQIRRQGLQTGVRRLNNWLAPEAVYLVVNRPRVALKFAEDRASEDESEPIVLDVHLVPPPPESVLNLTSDDGMNLFYVAYEGNRRILRERQRQEHVEPLPDSAAPHCDEYDASLLDAERALLDSLSAAHEEWLVRPSKVNWDTQAVEALLLLFGYSAVIAVAQEGTTFNRLFARTEPRYRNVPSYRGVRVRDHIQVCLMDPSFIDMTKSEPVSLDELAATTNQRFFKILTAPLMPDGEDR